MRSMDPNGQAAISRWNEGICHDCSVLGGIITLQTADGADAMDHDVYIHHILTFDTDKETEPFVARCPTTTGGSSSGGGLSGLLGGLSASLSFTPFLGVGEDNKNTYKLYTPGQGPPTSGYHIGEDDTFLVQSDLVNYGAGPIDVFITLDMEWVDGHIGKDAYSTLLQVQGCSQTPIKTDPNGPANTTSDRFPILSDGTIVSARESPSLHT
jgi:hypothetical protein